ncbi:MAG: hypothetical protein CMJ64_29150 [Planctomycetaceae bacterium]|nr:hypothetical protein [Planctomycetaceae bacterium]
MPSSLSASSDATDPASASLAAKLIDAPTAEAAATDPVDRRNFAILALYQIVMRTGWIFKTESIIMPAVVDYISGAGWIRGCLPMLNRFGHSIPPVLLARQVKLLPRKKWAVFTTTTLMSALFLGLTWLFFAGFAHSMWMPAAFLVIYALFFMCIGINQLAFTTVQGKLVETTKRGRLLLVSSIIGAVSAVLFAFVLLPLWLQGDTPRFDLIFGFSGVLFAGSALSVLFLVEEADDFQQDAASNPMHYFVDTYQTLRDDRNFRLLAFVGTLFGMSFMLFPHYQSLGLRTMNLELKSLMWWVVVQNIGTGLFSIPVGWIADRKGNRLVLQIGMLGIVAGPALAILMLHAGELGTRLYHFVFVLVGLTPVVLKTLYNYTLEISDAEDHPRYLSTLSLCSALPMFLSPLVGYFVDLFGFEAVFLAIATLVLIGWLLTFGLQEPRHHAKK